MGRSYLVVTGDTQGTAEIDFNLSERTGIELIKCYGTVAIGTLLAGAISPTPRSLQTLHFRTGTLEDNNFEDAGPAQQIDSEIVYEQLLQGIIFDGTTEAAAALMLNPSQAINYEGPTGGLFTARNITHQVDGAVATWVLRWQLIFHYYFVAFTDAELGVLFGRRS